MENPIFVIKSNHSSNCGSPPLVTNDDPNKYYSYFENEYHEQFIFIYDCQTGNAELRGGDADWEKVYQVENGCVPELILSATERMWLQACWKAATDFK